MAEDTMTTADAGRKDADAKLDAIADALSRINSRMDSMEMADKARKDAEEKHRADKARHDAARKDRFGARKDGESDDDFKKRFDADEAAMCDAFRKDGDDEEEAKKVAKDARKDAEEEDEKGRADRARKDEAEDKSRKDEEEERADKARHDSVKNENAELRAQLARMDAMLKGLTTETPASERDALAAAQSRADAVSAMFGERASPPIPGETPLAYRKRLLGKMQRHSDRFKETRFDSLDAAVLGPIEDVIYADALAAGRNPTMSNVGSLVPIVTREGGRDVTRFHGDIGSWMQHFMSGAQVGSFNRNPKAH